MKALTSSLLLASVLLIFAAPAEARERRGESVPPERGSGQPRVQGLQLSSGLQMSGSLNGSGPAPVTARLNDDEWKKLFARRTAAK